MPVSATIVLQVQVPYHALAGVRKMSQSKVVRKSVHVSATIAFRAQVAYHTLTSVG